MLKCAQNHNTKIHIYSELFIFCVYLQVSDTEPRKPLPPQIFNGQTYCGDYNGFELANECDTLEAFLHLPETETTNGSTNGKSAVDSVPVEVTQIVIEEPVAAETETEKESANGDKVTDENQDTNTAITDDTGSGDVGDAGAD